MASYKCSDSSFCWFSLELFAWKKNKKYLNEVEGILYEISEKDIKELDKHEGYPSHYNKITVRVNLKDGKEVEAVTYVAQPDKVRDGLKPCREYLNHLLKGCDLLSEEYCEKLRKWETLD